jgi:hypothetical protein
MRTNIRLRLCTFLCFVLASGSLLGAQSVGVVRGRVLDSRGAPVVRVKVTIGTQWSYTDAVGRYLLSRVPYGRHRGILERGGRRIDTGEIVVQARLTDLPDFKW